MNYIKHLTAFLQKVKSDDRLNSSHISLYLALFHYWNINMFENPLSVNRAQMLGLSKIGSQHTYYKCLKELHSFGYIHYVPSHHPAKGCLVYLCTFDITLEDTCAKMHNSDSENNTSIAAELHKYGCKNDITLAAKMQPSINNTNNKTYCGETTQTENLNSEDMKTNNQSIGTVNKSKRKKVAQKKEKVMQPPELEKVITFFRIEGFSEIEARKFFNHFESNGWRVGGKSPMKNWHAAARNWMLNVQKFTNPGKPNSTSLNTKKRYDIPL